MKYLITRHDGPQFMTDDPAALQPEWGKPAWTETIPAYTDTTVDPPVDHPEQVIEHPAEFTVTDAEIDKPLCISRAWEAARAFIERQFDSYSQISATNLRMDPACPSWRAERIGAVMTWISGVWAHYAVIKAKIEGGEDATFDPSVPGPCPWTIWQIAAEQP